MWLPVVDVVRAHTKERALRARAYWARLSPTVRKWAPVAVVVIAALAILLLYTTSAEARPGGGQSFSGGSRSSGGSSSSGGSRSSGGGFSSGGGSSSGGDGGDGIVALIFLLINVPALGIPILIIVIGYFIWSKMRDARTDWSTAGRAETVHRSADSPRRTLEQLRAEDQNFSVVLLEDFLSHLYAQVHEARGRNGIEDLGPYLADNVRGQLRTPPGLRQVKGIVLGAMRFVGCQLGPQQTILQVEFESTMTEAGDRGEQAFYAVERWTLVRRRGAQSRTPDKARSLGCPNCGAPRTALRGTRCAQCNTAVGDGNFDWTVTQLLVVSREPRPPLLTGTVEEQGTDFPTIIDSDAQQLFGALQAKDPQVSWQTFTARVNLAFNELQVGWSTQNLAKSRPFMTDALFQTLFYWIDTYKRQNLRNVTEQTTLQNVVLARVTTDRFYDAVTVRIYAKGLDYTIDPNNNVVAGSRSKPRAYSEYWTLVRGSQRKGQPRAEPVCPNCGAPLNVSMAGTCNYCNVQVTTGEFDWVISRIEQDEAYSG